MLNILLIIEILFRLTNQKVSLHYSVLLKTCTDKGVSIICQTLLFVLEKGISQIRDNVYYTST